MLEPGYAVDRYTVVEKIGEGGMAVVYRVEHATLGTSHALKVLTMSGTQVRDRLVQEGRVQATLQHPHIVAVTDVLDVDGAPGLLMEYVDGPSLDDWLAEYRPTMEEATVLFRAIVAGVGLAHARGLIHRDLKPGNVMLQVTDQGIVAKVTDFGLAKLTAGKGSDLKRTRTGMAMGTPAYMAPEQIRDASTVDRRADLYSLGCILYELVCGETPFQGNDMLSLFAAIAAGNYTPIRERVPDVTRGIEAVIEALILDDLDERCPDCAGILDLLDDRLLEPAPPRASGAELPPPRPIGTVGMSVLPSRGRGADVARGMTRGIMAPEAISQAPWTSVAPSSQTPAPVARTEAPLVDSMSHSGGVTRGAAAGAALFAVGGSLFLGFVVITVVLALWFLGDRSSAPTDGGPVVVMAPEPTAEPEPSPAPEPTAAPVAAPVPLAAPDPTPAPVPVAAPDPTPAPGPTVVPDPSPVVQPEPVVPAPAASADGILTIRGDTSAVVLKNRSTGARVVSGQPLPAGRYDVFINGTATGQNHTIEPGRSLSLKCVAVFQKCE